MEKRILDRLLKRIRRGTLSVTFPDGKTQEYGRGTPKVRVMINKPGILRKALRSPSLVLGEAYVNGDIEISEPIEDAVILAEHNPMKYLRGSAWRQLRRLNKNVTSKQQKYIAHHYDRGNDFYKLWLDPTMTYSCAYFRTKRDRLEQAQKQKTEHILRKLQLKPGMSLLDIGSGWGYLLVQAAKKYNVRGVGITLSQQQVGYARELARREGVDKLVTFRLQNYQDVPAHETFDRVVSVGFFEHVGRGNHDTYFRVVERTLKEGGISVLHSITHQDEVPSDAWIDTYIFPGGYLPSVRETTALLADHNFYLFDYENLGQHYGMTIEKWFKNYEKNRAKVIEMYGEKFYRMWRLYLLGAMTTFKLGNSNLSQWTFKKGQDPSWPLTREYLYR